MAVTILLGEAITLLIKLQANFAEHHIDMVSCIHCKCQTRAGVPGDVNKMLELTVSFLIEFWNERAHR